MGMAKYQQPKKVATFDYIIFGNLYKKEVSMATPRWIKSKKHWRMDVMYKGQRHIFYSSNPSKRAGSSECKIKFEAWKNRIDQGLQGIKVKDAWQEFITDYRARRKPTSANVMQDRYNSYLKNRFETRYLHDIKRPEWQSVIDTEFQKKSLSAGTLKTIASTIKIFCRFCAAKGYINDSDVPINFIIPAQAKKQKKRALHPNELRDLMNKERDHEDWYIPMFRFLIFTGLRRGELCALIKDRDLKLPYLHVRESLSVSLELGSPKNSKARKEYLSLFAIDAIDLHMENRKEKGITNCPNLFCSITGKMINPIVLTEKWQKYRERHKLDNITLHELRHTFASYTSKTLTLKELKELLGHSDGMDTKGVYVHDLPLTKEEQTLKEQQDIEANKRIEKMFKTILEK